MSVASVFVCATLTRLACERLSRRFTSCWVGRTRTIVTVLAAALGLGSYLRLEQHPPVVLVLVLLPYFLAVLLVVSTVVLGAARSGVNVAIPTIFGFGAAILGII